MRTSIELLSQLYNAFNPFEPLPAGDVRYVDCQDVRGDADILTELGNKMQLTNTNTCQLYSGHRGGGKSTKPDDYYAWYDWGYALGNLGRHEEALTKFCEAIASFDKALSIQPDDYYAWYDWGYALGNLGRHEEALTKFCEAIASFDKALSIQPDDYYAWYDWGYALGNLGRHEEALTKFCEAIASYDRALSIQPDYHYAWYGKACCYALQGNINQAIENLQIAINLNPQKWREWAKTDSDFDSIRDDERFQALIQE